MEIEAAQERYKALHEKQPYHDGAFKSWGANRSPAHPYHHNEGVTIWVAPADLSPHDHFLGGAEDCDECLGGAGPVAAHEVHAESDQGDNAE